MEEAAISWAKFLHRQSSCLLSETVPVGTGPYQVDGDLWGGLVITGTDVLKNMLYIHTDGHTNEK